MATEILQRRELSHAQARLLKDRQDSLKDIGVHGGLAHDMQLKEGKERSKASRNPLRFDIMQSS